MNLDRPAPIDSIEDMFAWHNPTDAQKNKLLSIREAAKSFAYAIHYSCPPSPDRTTAIRKVKEAAMTACNSVVSNGIYYR